MVSNTARTFNFVIGIYVEVYFSEKFFNFLYASSPLV
jgi:hypothetical protein